MKIVAYTPVAGLTIEKAIKEAIKITQQQHCTVIAIMNDIVMFMTKNTNAKKTLEDYKAKVQLRYYTEQIRRTR